MTKKFIAGLMAFVLLFGSTALPQGKAVIAPAVTEYAANTADGKFQYSYCDTTRSGIEIQSYLGKDTNVVIPSKIDGLPVVSIKRYAFSDNSKITSVTIPDSVTTINWQAFENCTNLTAINGAGGLQVLGSYAFKNTGLKKLNLAKSVTEVGYEAFANCKNLETISFPSGLTNIRGKAFENTKWIQNKRRQNSVVTVNGIVIDGTTCSGNITIPNGVVGIGDNA